MPRVLREEMAPLAGASVAVVSFALLLETMPDLDTKLTAVTTMLLVLDLLQWILAPMRRHSDHWIVQYGTMASYYLHFPLAAYAVKVVSDSSESNRIHADWCYDLALYLYPCMVGSLWHSMSAYTLGDGGLGGWSSLRITYLFFCIWNLTAKLEAKECPSCKKKGSVLHTIMTAFKFIGPILSNSFPISQSLDTSKKAREAKACADYMEEEANSLSPFFNSSTDGDDNNSQLLHGCKYPIVVERHAGGRVSENLDHVSTYIRIYGTAEEDIFLSYSLFQLLVRRYFGFHCAEEGNAEVRDFALRELMLPDYNRAFAIVETQLAFLHDYFFTTTYTYVISEPYITLLGLIPSTYSFTFLMVMMLPPRDSLLAFKGAVLFLIGLVIWWCQKEQQLATGWYTIQNAVRKQSPTPPSRSNNTSTSWFRRRYLNWKKEIGQYSLIKDYDSYSAKKTFLFLLKGMVSYEWQRSLIGHDPVEDDAIRLPDSVRKLVARTLSEYMSGLPTNGTTSLQRNTMGDGLSWTCTQETHTHTILIWHIATCYCDMPPPDLDLGSEEEEIITTCYQVSTALSRYCAYLVAFRPEFLPVNKLTTQNVFQDVLKQAKRLLVQEDKQMSMEEKRIKIRGLELPDEEALLTTFEKGVKLGRQLEELNNPLQRWKVLAEFWAETILYVAPSDNVALHFNHIAKGGEFVTHLWAMLSNAGILKRAWEE